MLKHRFLNLKEILQGDLNKKLRAGLASKDFETLDAISINAALGTKVVDDDKCVGCKVCTMAKFGPLKTVVTAGEPVVTETNRAVPATASLKTKTAAPGPALAFPLRLSTAMVVADGVPEVASPSEA